MRRTSAGDWLVGWSSVGAAHAARRHTHVGTDLSNHPTKLPTLPPHSRPGIGEKKAAGGAFRPAGGCPPTDRSSNEEDTHARTYPGTHAPTHRQRQADRPDSVGCISWLAGWAPSPTHPPKDAPQRTHKQKQTACVETEARPISAPPSSARSIEKRPKRKGQSKRRPADPKNPPRRPRARRERGSMEGPEEMPIRMWA